MRTLLFSRLIFKTHLTLCLEMLFFMTVLFTFQTCSLGSSAWRYSSHPYSVASIGLSGSELGVQQGDPLVLHKILQSIDADDDCLNIIFQAWYLDDGSCR